MVKSILVALCIHSAPCGIDESVYWKIISDNNCGAAFEMIANDKDAMALLLSGAAPYIICDYGNLHVPEPKGDRSP